MAINKLLNNVTSQDIISTTNEIIDSLGNRNIGEIVASTIPLTDAGLHLLDGALISGSGSYSAFVDYIAGLVTNYPDLFETEANWQQAVTDYGVCGKFVYDSINNTVRLPKITGIVEGTTDLTALGDLVEAGLPNITGTVSSDYVDNWSGAFYSQGQQFTGNSGSGVDSVAYFDASRCSSIYGNSTTVQPQTIKVLYYIVIATSTKTDIQVDIDEIATDLNGKADTDLSNTTPAISFATSMNTAGIRTIVETYINNASWYRVYSDGWCEQGGIQALSNQGSISLLKNFINTNYSVQLTQNAATYDYTYNTAYTKTTSSFKVSIVAGTSGTSGSIAWYAYGYIS